MDKLIENTYNVPPILWKKFQTEEARKIYNGVMFASLKNKDVLNHPEANIQNNHWRTICHNLACLAVFEYNKL